MILARVVGSVWSTVKDPSLEGQRLVIVQPVNTYKEAVGKPVVCLDVTGAGAGELIYYCRGKESTFPFLPKQVVTDMTVVAIVDTLDDVC